MQSGNVSESTSLSANPIAGNVKVLDEGVSGGLYQVRIQVDPVAAPRPGVQRCDNPGGRVLRRRVVAAHFGVDHPADAADLDSIDMKLPHEFAVRLAARFGDSITVRDAGNMAVMPNAFVTDPHAGSSNARLLAKDQDVQFVVAGRLISAAVTDRSIRPSFWASLDRGSQDTAYDGPFYQVLGNAVVYRAVARQFDFELWVYDGLTGSVLTTQRFTVRAEGNVLPNHPAEFASDAFWDSDYGKAIAPVLDQAVDRIAATVSCIPFSSHVVRVDSGGKVYLDAGGMDGLQVGDKLLVYRTGMWEDLQSLDSQRPLGIPETLVGDVSVIQVQPLLSVGVVQGAHPVQEGDIVRFAPRR
jgi:hypothetical protein